MTARAKLYLASPTKDMQVAGPYAMTLVHLFARPPCEIAIPDIFWDEDLVRVRSRYVRAFLESDCTHILWADSDNAFAPETVAGMLATGHDVVAAPYPKKRIHWEEIDAARRLVPIDDLAANAKALEAWALPAEVLAYEYPITLIDQRTKVDPKRRTLEIAGVGLGCAITSRKCLEEMVEHYGPELTFDDRIAGQVFPTVALFQLMIVGRDLLSEDHSFCRRWREMGGTVNLYLGPGSPVDHMGVHRYRGRIEAFTR